MSKYTASKRPLRLRYFEKYSTRTDALRRENDLDKRMSKHFDGMSKYTASKRPLRLRYFEKYSTRTDALRREKEIKKYKSRKYIESLLEAWRKELASG